MSKFTKWGENFPNISEAPGPKRHLSFYFLLSHSVKDFYSCDVLNIQVFSVNSFSLLKEEICHPESTQPLSCWILSRPGLPSSLLPLAQVGPPHHMITGGISKPERRCTDRLEVIGAPISGAYMLISLFWALFFTDSTFSSFAMGL